MSLASFRVEPSGGGFVVVESTPEGYDIMRGWTYPRRDLAEDALPLVAAGMRYPSAAQLYERRVRRDGRIDTQVGA